MGNVSSGIPIPGKSERGRAQPYVFDEKFIETSLGSLERMNAKVVEGLEKKEIWNGNLIQNIISNAESYVKNQRILVILLGSQKAGKTTMLNALLGLDLIPHSFNSTTPQTAILVSVGYHSQSKISVKQCDPSTFIPLEEDSSSPPSSLLELNEVGPFIDAKISKEQSNSSLPSVQAAFNHSVKVFEILVNAEIFEQYPIEVRQNIRFIDTPGMKMSKNNSNQQIPFLNCVKSLFQEGSPLIKFYIWVTPLRHGEVLQEKKLFEQSCLQLSLRESTSENNYFSRSNQFNNSSEEYKGKLEVLESICNVIRFSSSLSETHSNTLLDSINPFAQKTLSDFVYSDDSSRIPPRVLEIPQEQDILASKQTGNLFHGVSEQEQAEQDSEDDFQLVDEEQVRQDSEELRLRFETISNLRTMKFKRQMMVVVNQQDDRSLFLQGQSFFFSKSLKRLPDEKIVSHLESELESNAIRTWPLIALLNRQLDSAGFGSSSTGSSKAETEIMTKFNNQYKDIFKSFKEEQVFLSRDRNERGALIESSGFLFFQRQIARSIQELLDFKIMKRRRRIQEVIDKSCSFSSKIILNQAKKQKLDLFIMETLPIIHSNHEILIKNHLHDLHNASANSRAAIVSAINQVYSEHKLYSLFDKVEAQLNSLVSSVTCLLLLKNGLNNQILEYLRDTVQSLANSMDKGDQIIEENKDIILNELKEIDPSLQEGIKSIITDFKKRSMQRANHAITSNMCMALQQNFSILSKVLGTSSIVTGITVLLQRMAGKSLIGSGPTGLAVAVGMTAVSTVWYVNEREKKLKEAQSQILQYLADLESGQERINQQLIQSYSDVYKEVIEVIRDYLTGISSTTFDQLLKAQSQLKKQDQDLEGAGSKSSGNLFRAFSQGTITSSSGDSDSERSEEVEYTSQLNSEYQAHEQRNFERKSIKINPDDAPGSEQCQDEQNEELFYSFHSEDATADQEQEIQFK